MLIRTIATWVVVVSLGLLNGWLVGCEHKTIDTACTAFVPIRYSSLGDTAETVTQVRQFNAAWVALCK